ncbi:hypothetical protein BDV96DRAFT_606484 [Lophiotrema nucula]|uniref:Uncharacterized protein n=1 Tax=Lophiotrema nucula TaxID=690887 RepID=A0A6A5YJN7_9PLEO|nr:hypothetical protein BDV96DRAFT_606484 [Lophiotrema nucula]
MADTLPSVKPFTNGQHILQDVDNFAVPIKPGDEAEIPAKAGIVDAATSAIRDDIPSKAPFGSFKMNSVDRNLEQKSPMMKGLSFRKELEKPPPLGPLPKLQGTWVGTGFNMIFRPRNKASKTTFPNNLNLEGLEDDNLLQMNPTSEQLTFLD